MSTDWSLALSLHLAQVHGLGFGDAGGNLMGLKGQGSIGLYIGTP